MNKHIIDIINDCIESIRLKSNILNIIDNNNNTYTFYVDNLYSLIALSWITITSTNNFNTTNQQIISIDVNAKSFIIQKVSGLTISTFGNVAPNSPYYDYGYWIGESNKLMLKSQSITYINQLFPLIFIQLEFEEEEKSLLNSYYIPTLKVYLLTETKQDTFSDWRLTNTFKSILIPLYQKFITALTKSNYIHEKLSDKIVKKYTEKHLMQIITENKSIVNNWVDVIELDLNLTYKNIGDCKLH